MQITSRIGEFEVYQAFGKILENRQSKAVNYAVGYAQVGLYLTGHDLRVQALYVLSNITHWRGETAHEVRAVLKAFTR